MMQLDAVLCIFMNEFWFLGVHLCRTVCGIACKILSSLTS
jgi:hypothetical protein